MASESALARDVGDRHAGFGLAQACCCDLLVGVAGLAHGAPLWVRVRRHFVTTGSGSGPGALVEYAHGGTAPIQTLFDPSAPMDCSVDHVTGNLAVANGCFSGSCGSNLAIFRHASGSPAIYPLPAPDGPPYSCTYDAAGNVFIAAYEDVYKTGTLWLPKGGTALSRFLLVPRPYPHAGLQWDGTRLAIEISDTEIYQYKLRPHSGHRRHATFLQDGAGRRFWIQGNILVGGSNGVFLWRYPAGGGSNQDANALGKQIGLRCNGEPRKTLTLAILLFFFGEHKMKTLNRCDRRLFFRQARPVILRTCDRR